MNQTTKSKRISSKSVVSPLAGTDGQLMVMAAHRYCLGRQSYIVGSCIEWLKAHWDKFEDDTKNVIVRDTIEALADDSDGDFCDRTGWWAFASSAWGMLTPEGRAWVSGALSHKREKLPDMCKIGQATLDSADKNYTG